MLDSVDRQGYVWQTAEPLCNFGYGYSDIPSPLLTLSTKAKLPTYILLDQRSSRTTLNVCFN